MKNSLRLYMLIAALASAPLSGRAQEECGHSTLVANESKYDIGKFYECINGLRPCLDAKGFNYEDRKQAYQLMAMCYLAIDSVDEADKYIERLLTINDNFQPDSHTPQRFRSEVNVIRSRMRATRISSVSKKNENIDHAPATIQIITDEDIRRRGYKDIEEIFSDIPGFDVSRTRGVSYSVLYQRGYRTSANTDRTMILVDGVEDNDMWSNAAYIGKQFPISNIKRIEIIYGPASTIYGANAYSGVVNIVTKGEEDFFSKKNNNKVSATALVGAGSFNTRYANATVATRSRQTFFSLTAGTYFSDEEDLSKYPEYDGLYSYSRESYKTALTVAYSAKADSMMNLKDPEHKYHVKSGNSIVPTDAAIDRAKSLDSINYRKTFRGVDPGRFSNEKRNYYVSSKLSIGDFKFQFEYFNRDEGAAPDYTEKFNSLNSKLQNWQVRQGHVSLRYDKKLSDRFTLTSFSYYRISDRGDNAVLTTYTSYNNSGFAANKGVPLDSLIRGVNPYFTPGYRTTTSTQFRSETRGVYTVTDKIDVTGAVELRNGLMQGDYITSAYPDALVTATSLSTTYYFVTDLGLTLLGSYKNTKKKFNVNLGGRMDNNVINSKGGYGSVFNPRISVIYYPSKFIFKAIYSEAFLDASPFNKFATTSARALANPTLKPEKVKNIEASARYKIMKGTDVEVAYYHSYYSNSLVTATVDYNGGKTTQFQALGKADIQGVQLSAQSSFSIFSIYANATYCEPYSVNASKLTGKDSLTRMGDIASYSANLGVNVVLPKNFNINVRMNYVGDKKTGKGTTTNTNPYSSTPEYTILNGTISYLIKRVGTLQLRCDNILDKTYYAPGTRSASGIQASRIIQPGRIFYAQFSLNLNN